MRSKLYNLVFEVNILNTVKRQAYYSSLFIFLNGYGFKQPCKQNLTNKNKIKIDWSIQLKKQSKNMMTCLVQILIISQNKQYHISLYTKLILYP
ncbi:hypothetical protein pb186bvf_011344 [Paramecium bursaria]